MPAPQQSERRQPLSRRQFLRLGELVKIVPVPAPGVGLVYGGAGLLFDAGRGILTGNWDLSEGTALGLPLNARGCESGPTGEPGLFGRFDVKKIPYLPRRIDIGQVTLPLGEFTENYYEVVVDAAGKQLMAHRAEFDAEKNTGSVLFRFQTPDGKEYAARLI